MSSVGSGSLTVVVVIAVSVQSRASQSAILVDCDFTSKDTSLWSSGIRAVLIASIKFSVDCSLCLDWSVKGCSTVDKYLDSWYVGDPQNETIGRIGMFGLCSFGCPYRLRCPVPQPPKLYGLPKLHKPNIPMRSIVSFCGSPTYQLSKYLSTVLQPLTDQSRHKLQSTENFIDAIKTARIPDDHRLVSFDVKSQSTSTALQLALDCTETAITTTTVKLPLPTDDIMNLCLTSTYSFSTTANTTNGYTE